MTSPDRPRALHHQGFTRPPNLTLSRPRYVELTMAGRAMVAASLVLFVAAAAGGPLLYQESRRQTEARRVFLQDGVVVTGEVVRLQSNGNDNRRVSYRFIAEGRAHDGRAEVSSARYRALRVGAAIDVRYLPGTPAVNRLASARGTGLPIAVPFIAAAGLASVGILFLWLVGRQRWLLSEGRVASAVVTKREPHKSAHGTKSETVTYEFPLLNGSVAKGKSTFSKSPPAAGSVICVLYDPERPQRSAVYPFLLVRPGV